MSCQDSSSTAGGVDLVSPDDVQVTTCRKSVGHNKDMESEYLRYLNSKAGYYRRLLSSKKLLPAKSRQLSKKYNIIQAFKRRLLSGSSHPKDPGPILEDEVKISSSSDQGISEDYPGVEDMTLLKSLPYLGMGKEKEDKIDEVINDPHSMYSREHIDLVKITGLDSGEGPIRAGPVLQVFSVSISNKICSDWDEFEIYGEISVTDDKKNTFYIYKCERNEPELVSPEWNRLFLNGWPITPVYMRENVKVSIFKKDGDHKIFAGNYDVDYTIEDAAYETNKSVIECGDDGHGFCVSMEFTKIPFAFIAKVVMFLCDSTTDGKEVGTDFNIHGTIEVNKVLCFEAQSTNPVVMKHGVHNGFPVSTTVFAVPVYSSLVAEIKLNSGGHVVANDKLEAFPFWLKSRLFRIACKDKSYLFCMDVDWILYDDFFGHDLRYVDDANVIWNRDHFPQKVVKPPAAVNSECALVEVFSVFVGGRGSAPLALCGSIVVRDRDRDKTVYIFARTRECPDELSNKDYGLSNELSKERSRIVSLAWPDRWLAEKDFYMDLNLQDDRGKRVCRGGLRWWHGQGDTYPSRYDRRMCDVIRGANGYFVAVHYSNFKNGKKAKVSVRWKGRDCVVFGTIDAEYINCEYPSTYDKAYYRSIIFKRSCEDCLKVKSCSEIQLSKSHVSTPSDCKGLIVHVNLHVDELAINEPGPPQGYEHTFEFKADDETHVKSGGERISVEVEWFPSNRSP